MSIKFAMPEALLALSNLREAILAVRASISFLRKVQLPPPLGHRFHQGKRNYSLS
jgi:hypothetical protein